MDRVTFFVGHMRHTITINLFFILLFSLTMFLKADSFVENALLPKWYAFFAGTLIGCILWSVQQELTIKIDPLVLIVTLFIGYICIRTYCSEPFNIRALSPFFFLLIFILFKSICPEDLRHIDKIIVTVCVLQSLYGIMQFAGIFYISSTFNLLGSFDTPGGYAACLCAGYPLCFKFLDRRSILGLSSMAIIAAGIIISESRSGIIAIAIVSTMFFYNRYNLFFSKEKVWNSRYTRNFSTSVCQFVLSQKRFRIGSNANMEGFYIYDS